MKKKVPWSKVTIGNLQEFQKEFLEKGTVRIADGDKRTIAYIGFPATMA